MSRAETLRARLAVSAAAAAAFGVSLFSRGWPRDDRWLILEHPLIRAGWPGAVRLLTSGYVQPLLGAETPIHEWRPVLSLTFLLQRVATGFAPLPFHAANLALHVAVCLLVLEALRRRLGPRAAFAGALVYAVLPVHAEAVAYLSSRSELLAALSVLGAWLALGAPENPAPRRVLAGTLIYAAGALSKESALLFPVFLALADWTFAGRKPWEPGRRGVYAALAAAAALVLLGRALVLPSIADGGVPYFSGVSYLTRLLTVSKYAVWFYVRPALTGAGLCSDFARPLVPDASYADPAAWAALLALAAAFAAAARAVARRRSWGFWLLGPCLFLLPTSHLIINLDTLGAQRFLYFPCLGLAAAAGTVFARAEARRASAARAALAAAVLVLGARAAVRAADWRDDAAYYRAAVACNPVSAKARNGLGLAYLRGGDEAAGAAALEESVRLGPRLYDPVMNLALLAYRHGDLAQARARLDRARALRPDAPDGLTLQALLDERAGDRRGAAAALTRAVAVNPDDFTARFDLARALAETGRPDLALAQLDACARLAPAAGDREDVERLRAAVLAPGAKK
ncbi:MAG: tetratricopeptide repeat protein [Elusimicrobia bacterium]|nr:tetratricopeptide repeat protein [Elusimicrobiota bacterium]